MMYTLICVYYHISAQIGLVITIHVEEFCFGFDEQENAACQLICCIKKKNLWHFTMFAFFWHLIQLLYKISCFFFAIYKIIVHKLKCF